MRRALFLRPDPIRIPASFRDRIELWIFTERARGVGAWRISCRRSVAVPLHWPVGRTRDVTASTKGSKGGGVSKAARISASVQPRAGAAATAQARAPE